MSSRKCLSDSELVKSLEKSKGSRISLDMFSTNQIRQRPILPAEIYLSKGCIRQIVRCAPPTDITSDKEEPSAINNGGVDHIFIEDVDAIYSDSNVIYKIMFKRTSLDVTKDVESEVLYSDEYGRVYTNESLDLDSYIGRLTSSSVSLTALDNFGIINQLCGYGEESFLSMKDFKNSKDSENLKNQSLILVSVLPKAEGDSDKSGEKFGYFYYICQSPELVDVATVDYKGEKTKRVVVRTSVIVNSTSFLKSFEIALVPKNPNNVNCNEFLDYTTELETPIVYRILNYIKKNK